MNSSSSPKAWADASSSELSGIRGVCLDIDDTLSTHGKLTAKAYSSLWSLKEAGYVVVPLTGRPAGWCDHFARFWPVDAIIGENGAFSFFMQGGVIKRLNTPGTVADPRVRLKELGEKIHARFPKARWASDQLYREFDLAIDICEDVPPWTDSEVKELLELCHGLGAHAKLSSIHVNAWFGDYDKFSGFSHWLRGGAPGIPSPEKAPALDEWLFIGDSPNDEPLFENFKFSVGVANLGPYLDQIEHPPTWITQKKSGEGFSEMVERLLQSRA